MIESGPIDASPPPPRRAHVTAPELRLLLEGGNYLLLGVTTGFEPYAVYYEFHPDDTVDVAAVSVYGGAPVVLQKAIAEADNAFVSGGAVAWYTNTTTFGLASAVSIWTPENGTKTLATSTVPGIFAASRDGSRVAFSARAELEETSLVVTTSSAPSLEAPALSGEETINLSSVAAQCVAALEFRGSTLFGTFCTGPAPDAEETKLFTVDAAGAAVLRANGNILFFDADAVARRAFVFTDDLRARLLTIDGPNTTVKDLGEVNDVRLLADGTGAVVLRQRTLMRVAEDELTLATDATVLYGMTPDSKTVLYATTDPEASASDLEAIAVSGGAPVALVTAPTVRFIEPSATSTHAIYRTDVVNGVGALKAIPIAGGAEITLAPVSFGANVATDGTGVLAVSDASGVAGSQAFRATFAYTDVMTAAPPLEMATVLLTIDAGRWVDRSFVYQDQGTSPGLFALEVP